jgi:hypothetical protein
MVIDQRNNGAAVTPIDGVISYPVDRFGIFQSGGNFPTAQRSSVVPTGAGFINSVLITAGTASTPTFAQFTQRIEGLNAYDLMWGSASAATVTLSFWVRSSVTGTYSVSFRNSAADRSYIATYSISVANTWEQKTLTIPGDTSGTWLTTNGVFTYLVWDLKGNGSGTAGSWTATSNTSTSGSTGISGTTGATFYITGVQLEKGVTATSFDYRPYGTELSLCQRYYEALSANASGAISAGQFITLGVTETTTRVQAYYPFKVQKRVAPSTTLSTISSFGIRSSGSSVACSSGAFGSYSTAYAQGEFNNAGGGLIAGGCAWLTNQTGSATIQWSAEL